MSKKHFVFSLFLAAFIILPVFAAGIPDPADRVSPYKEADAEFVMTIATTSGTDSVNHHLAWKAKELLEDRSNGRIFANVYEAGSLGSDREIVEGVLSGSIDFMVVISPLFVPFAPKTGIFDLPNAFPNLEVARRVLDSEILEMVKPEYEQAGFIAFGFSDAGFRETTSSRPLRVMDDFKGLKIRTMENANHLAYWRALGANPTPMDFSELYISLQQGVIDAQENPIDLIVANKLYENQKYIINTNHLMHTLMMNMSKIKYDELPADLQEIVTRAIEDTLQYGREVGDARNQSREEIVLDAGCEILDIAPEVREEILQRIKPVYETIRQSVDDDALFDTYLNIIARETAAVEKGKQGAGGRQ